MTKYRYPPEELARMEACPWLSDRERRAFDLYYKREWAIEDVAAEIGFSRSTVDRTLRSIRSKTK